MPGDDQGSCVVLSPRFVTAVGYAADATAGHPRKGTRIPYLAHLLAVCALVLESGGDEDEAVAALLHDVVEDQPLPDGGRLVDLENRFGDRVARIVADCSAEAKDGADGHRTWQRRKRAYIAHMSGSASPSAVLVSLADKLHNARAILADYRSIGRQLWKRFNAPEPESVLWYYRELLNVYRDRIGQTAMVDELGRVIGQLAALMSRPNCPGCGAGDVVPIEYGYPSAELRAAHEEGGVALGGCVISGAEPDLQCRCCHRDFHSTGGVNPQALSGPSDPSR